MLQKDVELAEKQLQLKLEEIRNKFRQSGDKGSSVEEAVREFLRNYLPRKLNVGQGEIIDSHGTRSNQTDIVIITDDHPRYTEPGLFFVEGVSAVGEIKSILDSKELRTSLTKARISKKLRINPGINTIANINPSDANRFYTSPPYFLLAFESRISLEKIKSLIEEDLEKNGSLEPGLIDGVFVLGKGCVIDYGDGQGGFRFVHENMSIPGLIPKPTNSVLFTFLHWLTSVMPRMIRFSSILDPYFEFNSFGPEDDVQHSLKNK